METKTRPSRLLPYLALLGTVLVWGLSFVSSKTILNAGVPPMSMVFLRFAVATVLLFLVLRIREPAARLGRADVLPLMASGFFGVTVYFFFESRGIRLTSASNASLIIATIPVFTVLAELVFRHKAVSPLQWGGVALSVAGVWIITRRASEGAAAVPVLGNLMMLGACLSWVVYMMLSRDLHGRLSDLSITTYQAAFGTLFLAPFALAEYPQWVPLGPLPAANILYLAVFCSALGNFLYVYALSRLGPVAVSPSVNLIPVVGVLGGVFLLGEPLSWTQIAGGVVIVAGVVVVNGTFGGARARTDMEGGTS